MEDSTWQRHRGYHLERGYGCVSRGGSRSVCVGGTCGIGVRVVSSVCVCPCVMRMSVLNASEAHGVRCGKESQRHRERQRYTRDTRCMFVDVCDTHRGCPRHTYRVWKGLAKSMLMDRGALKFVCQVPLSHSMIWYVIFREITHESHRSVASSSPYRTTVYLLPNWNPKISPYFLDRS